MSPPPIAPEPGAAPMEARLMHVYISIVAPVPPPSLVDRLTQHIRTHRAAWSSALLAVAGGLSALAGALALVDYRTLGPRAVQQRRHRRARAAALPPPSDAQQIRAVIAQAFMNQLGNTAVKGRLMRRPVARPDIEQMIRSLPESFLQKIPEWRSMKGEGLGQSATPALKPRGGEVEPHPPAQEKPPRR